MPAQALQVSPVLRCFCASSEPWSLRLEEIVVGTVTA